ncbi:hypothetical protein [Nostoc sp. T09]|nr:hypothetical protein [Nostoc sp. T09]
MTACGLRIWNYANFLVLSLRTTTDAIAVSSQVTQFYLMTTGN